ncbi:ankyrin repeat domain-containing protein SOWAHC [Austrofundulus limnaeus]|uniref:Ankyrin repeat domain-containing protein SOWAHC n=1 Tax=Austrofundulus limnaeus TaxID=52670 RepID=A0A2I4D1L2_AUSLI|nr:PREDICTED: ankyrin repeat domain-containing protein SOWAHC-like [Austrofundulus limnaeus]
MAGELTRESVLGFLKERGGKAEFLQHFGAALSAEEPREKAAARRAFKSSVDGVSVVRTETGDTHLCVKEKLRGGSGADSPASLAPEADPSPQVSPGDDAAPPGSGSGSDRERVPRFFAADSFLTGQTERNRARLESVCLAEEDDEEEEVFCDSCGMGNVGSVTRKEQQVEADLPRITVCEALPRPEQEAASDLPGPETPETPETPGLSPTQRCAGTPGSPGPSHLSVSESEGSVTPTPSRRRFIRAMMSSSPEVRRSVHLASRPSSDSLGSLDDRTPVTLDPAEHEWMMSASDGEWADLHRLLVAEPGLVQKRDFVTGFTCLHWAAKQGKPELLARILDFAEEHGVPAGVDARSSMGYTPLHVAAMHGHVEVVKLLVGAFSADVELRDHSGRRACQYLAHSASVDIRDIAGAHEPPEDHDRRGQEGRWRFSRVLQSNLKPTRLFSDDPLQAEARVRRRSSFSVMKPKLPRLRTSQIVHSSSFNHRDNVDVSRKASFRSRPHTHFLG